MILTYGAYSVMLREPEWGDSITVQHGILESRSRSQENRFHRPSNRTTRQRFTLTSVLNKTASITALLTLLEAGQGQIITAVIESVNYDLLINQETVEIFTAKDHCSYSISFDVEIV